ncbi:MAG: ATP-binding protein [Candidatus Thermoplasmatota archaeon]|nr:ATP-binding protein [Candidatus Thermoplasmatota archaeon]
MSMLGEDSRSAMNSTQKHYVLGRREQRAGALLHIGCYYALDGSLGAPVYVDCGKPHIILICGKRGYGKSYTIGVLLEELAQVELPVRQKLGTLVFDTLGIFWTMQQKNQQEARQLQHWKLSARGYDLRLFVPEKHLNEYRSQGVDAEAFSIPVCALSSYHWCQLFGLSQTDPLGIALTRAVCDLQSSGASFSIPDIVRFIHHDDRCAPVIQAAAENFFSLADSWGIFTPEGVPLSTLIQPGTLSVLDFSLFPGTQVKMVLASLLGEQLFEERVQERRQDERRNMGKTINRTGLPLVWLVMDEAQLFVPLGTTTISKEVFINLWMRQGRQPGLSLILATQRPSALDPEVLSHSDLILCHRLTAQEDIDALSRIRPTYLHGDIKEALKKIGEERGVALLIDDTSESSHIIKIRPRRSWHGGADATAYRSEPDHSTQR